MPRIRRHQTVQLDTGGWIDLKGCDVLWAFRFAKLNVWYLFFPGGIFFARKRPTALLLKTPQGALVAKYEETLPPETPAEAAFAIRRKRIAWREVSTMDAFLWLQQSSRWHARRLFPELAAQQREHTLSGER